MAATKDDLSSAADRRTILVAGAGYAGLRFFDESLDRVLNPKQKLSDSVRYVFVDERPFNSYGRGVAWASDQNPHMRANMHYPERDIDPDTQNQVTELLDVSHQHEPTATELFTQREKWAIS